MDMTDAEKERKKVHVAEWGACDSKQWVNQWDFNISIYLSFSFVHYFLKHSFQLQHSQSILF